MILFEKQGYEVLWDEWQVNEPHFAGYARIYYITGGCVTYRDSVQIRQLEIGKLYVFPSHAPFSITHAVDSKLCCLWYHADLFPVVIDKLIEFKVEGALEYLLKALISEISNDRIETDFYKKMVQALEAYILESGSFSSPEPELLNVLNYIRNSYTDRSCTVKSISMHFGYSAEYFIRFFKKHMNITPYQYITNLRMLEAQRLLLEGIPVTQIAEIIGYGECKAFSRAFSERYGIAPSRYKEFYNPTA